MNNLKMNVNPHVKKEIEKHDKKHIDRLEYIQKDVNKFFNAIISENKDKINTFYTEMMNRD